MRIKPLGRTGLSISEVSIGGGRVGGILIFPPEEVRAAALERASAAGINWVDTAPSYGDGESESTLGRLGRRFQISTKVQFRPGDNADIRGTIERSLEGSLRRLQREAERRLRKLGVEILTEHRMTSIIRQTQWSGPVIGIAVDNKGQKQTLEGQAGFQDGNLALLQSQGPPLIGKVTKSDPNKFVFAPPGGNSAPGLTFTK